MWSFSVVVYLHLSQGNDNEKTRVRFHDLGRLNMYKVVPVFVFFENKEFRSDVTSTGTLLIGSNLWSDFGPFAKFKVYSASPRRRET